MTLRERFIPPDVTLVIWLMMAGVTLVLLIACSNVANLMLARASARRREIAVRTAIGAARGRIVRQLLTEAVVLSLTAVPLGILLAEVGTRMIAAYMPPDQVPYYIHWEMDWRSLGYAVAIAVATAVAFGLFPALQMTRGNLHESLKEGTRGNSARRSLLRSSLVVVQVALALVALVGALLFVRTFENLDSYNFGFDVKPLMTMRFAMPGAEYEARDAKLRRVQDVVEKVEALAGVQAAFASNYVPLSGGGGGGQVLIEGRPEEHGSQAQISFIGVTPHYLKTMSVPFISGRDFTDAEGFSHSTVAIINESMAKKFWPEHNPVGARFRIDVTGEAGGWFTVIGVARDTKLYGVDPEGIDSPTPVAFVPYAYQQALTMGLTIRVAGDPASVTSSVREALRASDPNLPLYQARTMDDQRRLNYWQYRLVRLDLRHDRRRRHAARRDRALRGALVLRGATDAGNRRARRHGRGPARSAAPDHRLRPPARRPRRGGRSRARTIEHLPHEESALQRQPVRSGDVHVGVGVSPGRRRAGQLDASAARDAGGPANRAARRIGTRPRAQPTNPAAQSSDRRVRRATPERRMPRRRRPR